MIRLLFSFALLLICTGAFSQSSTHPSIHSAAKAPVKAPAKTLTLKTGTDSLSYALGVNMATYFKQQGIDHLNLDVLKVAILDVFDNKTPAMTNEQAMMTLQQQMQVVMMKKAAVNKDAGEKFLEENRKRPGVVSLPDGMQYEVIKMGTGLKPAATDTVTVDYTGYTLDGKKFDSSKDRGQPAKFPLNHVIKGWTEGVQLMPEGSEFKFYIPSELAYGDRGAGQNIPGGSLLIFDVELLHVTK